MLKVRLMKFRRICNSKEMKFLINLPQLTLIAMIKQDQNILKREILLRMLKIS